MILQRPVCSKLNLHLAQIEGADDDDGSAEQNVGGCHLTRWAETRAIQIQEYGISTLFFVTAFWKTSPETKSS